MTPRILTAAFCFGTVLVSGQAVTQFEVEAIRPNASGSDEGSVFFEPGRFVARNATAKMLIAYAYGVKEFQISGGPSWMNSERFDIVAKEDESVSLSRQKLPWRQAREQLGSMVQGLLADRFHLKLMHQPKEATILALMTAPGGPKLVASANDRSDFRGGRGRLSATGLSMAQLADVLSWMSELDSRKVVDETGLEGTFDVNLHWNWEQPAQDGKVSINQPDAPTLFSALPEQVGLRLKSTKGLLDHLVVQQLEHPSEN